MSASTGPAAPAATVLPPGPSTVAGLPPGPLTSAELAASVPAAGRGAYRRIWHGVYRRADQPDDLWLRGVALARTFPGGVLRGRSAALVWGDDSAAADTPPEIWLPSTRRARPGRVYRYGALSPAAVTVERGLRVTTPLRTCRDLAAGLPVVDAVVAIERMCAHDPALLGVLRSAVDHPAGHRDAGWREVVALVDPRSIPGDEGRMRTLLAASGFTGFGVGHVLRIGGHRIELPLADPSLRCAVVIRSPDGPRRGWTGATELLLRSAGWTLVTVVRLAEVGAARPGATDAGAADAVLADAGPTDAVHAVGRVLRTRWPVVDVHEPVDAAQAADPAADPHGIWAG